jgi:25S rRNA (cytosine2278-C5)-methyltransferase
VYNADFTTLNPLDEQFSGVTHILLDPSCSGSGLDRLDYGSPSDLEGRLRNLSKFQTRLLEYALSFPLVERVVYSTCSIHAEENERVVRKVLHDHREWRLLSRGEQIEGLRNWDRRGVPEEFESKNEAEACIRCEKGTDGTIGFFAVAFTRQMSANNGAHNTEDEEWQGIPE